MFGSTSTGFGGTSTFGGFGSTTTSVSLGLGSQVNPMKDVEVTAPPDDTVSALRFSPSANFLIASSWANDVRCWEVTENGQTIPKAQQTHTKPILDCCWHSDGTKVFTASADKTCKMWDLNSNQAMAIAQHDGVVRTAHWIQGPNYACLMTGSWDKTLKFWDTRQPNPMLTLQLPERCYCADVVYPMAIIGTAQRGIICYQLDNQPSEYKRFESPLKYQASVKPDDIRSLSAYSGFRTSRCVSIFKDPKKNNQPVGFALGSVEGRVAIHFIQPQNPKDNFTFKCHRSNGTGSNAQDIYAVNDIAFHPVHACLLATVGSDGRFSFWDKDARTKLKTSEQINLPISSCCFNSKGNIFAYSSGYDWSKGHEYFNPNNKPKILLRNCAEELKPRGKK